MKNPLLATRYAKALLGLALEQNKLEEVNTSMSHFSSLTQENKELANLFRSPIIKADKKVNIVNALVEKMGTDEMTKGFINLIITKRRDVYLPEIFTAFDQQYKAHKNIGSVELTVADELSEEMKGKIVESIKSQLNGQEVDLTIKVDEKLIGGFILESNNNLFDGSIARDLRDIKDQFLKNIYVPTFSTGQSTDA
jgi:F-type H+-transporting ATPase subunit delta